MLAVKNTNKYNDYVSIAAKHAYRFGYLKSEQWSNVRLAALARENGRCQICFEESLQNDAHHIWYPENIYETKQEHLVILCRACHDFLHTMMPECKTKDEKEGIANWIKFSSAIIAWRRTKAMLFGLSDGIKIPDPVLLRKRLAEVEEELAECRGGQKWRGGRKSTRIDKRYSPKNRGVSNKAL